MLECADHRPAHLVGVGAEMVVAERLKAGEHRVDLGLPGCKVGQGRLLVPARFLGVEVMASLPVVSCIVPVSSESLYGA